MAATLATERSSRGFLGVDGARLLLRPLVLREPARRGRRARGAARLPRRSDPRAGAAQGARDRRGASRRSARSRASRATRSLGMIGALDLGQPSGYLARRGLARLRGGPPRGGYLRPLGDVVYVAPPLNIPDADLDELLGKVEESIRAAT